MRRRAFSWATSGLSAALLALLSSCSEGDADGAANGGRDKPQTIRAAAIVTETSNIRESARSVGSLTANESVDVVAELSRRLVAVHVEEGAQVTENQVLFELDGADLRASLAELEARRGLAARTVERQGALMERDKKALSQQAFDQARADLRVIEAQITALRVTIDKTEIRAPFAGRIGIRRVSEGAWVTPSTVLTTLQDTSRIKIDFTLPERYAALVRVEQPFSFRVAGRSEVFAGTVTAIEPRIDAVTRSLLVRGITANEGEALVPGAFATIEMELAAAFTGVTIPAEALIPSVEGHSVYVLRDGKAELRAVELGGRTAESVQILRGLEPGETVLTSNLLRLGPGVAVEVEETPAADA